MQWESKLPPGEENPYVNEWNDLLAEPVDSMIPVAMPQEIKLRTLACLMNQVYPLVVEQGAILFQVARIAAENVLHDVLRHLEPVRNRAHGAHGRGQAPLGEPFFLLFGHGSLRPR